MMWSEVVPGGLEILWNKKGEPQLIRTVRHIMAATSFHRPKVGPGPLCISGTGMLQAPKQLFSVIFPEVYFPAEKNICPFDFLGINEKRLRENLINSLCYRWHQVRHSLGSEVTGCRGEGNESWPSSHACQVAWGQSVPINVNEDWRHSAPCTIKPKPKAAFLIKIALPSSFPKGTLICKNLLSLAVVSNWSLLTFLPIIRWESGMGTHQLRDSGRFKGSPGLLPLATPHLLSYHPTSFQPQLHLLYPSKAWEWDRQVHVHHHLVHRSSVGSGFAELPVGYLCHTLYKHENEEGKIGRTGGLLNFYPSPDPFLPSLNPSGSWAESSYVGCQQERCSLCFIIFCRNL